MYKSANPSVLEGKVLYSVHKKDNELHLLAADGCQYKFCHFKNNCQDAVSAISIVLGKEIKDIIAREDTVKSTFHEDFQDAMPSDEQWLYCAFAAPTWKDAAAYFILLGDGSGDNDGFPCFMELTEQHANPDVSPIES